MRGWGGVGTACPSWGGGGGAAEGWGGVVEVVFWEERHTHGKWPVTSCLNQTPSPCQNNVSHSLLMFSSQTCPCPTQSVCLGCAAERPCLNTSPSPHRNLSLFSSMHVWQCAAARNHSTNGTQGLGNMSALKATHVTEKHKEWGRKQKETAAVRHAFRSQLKRKSACAKRRRRQMPAMVERQNAPFLLF